MRLAPLACVVVLLSVTASAQTKDPVAGVWELTARKNLATNASENIPKTPLRVIYANGYFVQFTAEADRKVITKPTAEQTKDELLDRLRMQGNYGTYQVKGTQLIRKVITAAAPQNSGTESTQDFRIEGDTMITVSQNVAQGVKIEARFRRLK